MAIVLNSVREALEFLEGFDGEGLVITDNDPIVERLRSFAGTPLEVEDDWEDVE